MQATEIALIQTSFAEVEPISERAAALFYGRLFEIAPTVRPLFKRDMAEQGRKLMATLSYLVNGLADLPSVLPAASVLAKRHVAYGVTPGTLRCRGCGTALDFGEGPRAEMDACDGGGVDKSLLDTLRLHDRGSLWCSSRNGIEEAVPVGDTGYPLTLSLTRRGEGTIETPFPPGEREKVMV